MPLLVYTLTALALLWIAHRRLVPLSRGAAAFLFLLPFLFVGHALLTSRVYAPIDKTYLDIPLADVKGEYGIGAPHNPATADVFAQMIPWRHAVRESVRRGEWPLWNPYILSGDILAAAAQPAVYSPFTLLALLMPAPLSFTFTAAITFFLAALGTVLFARDLGCRELAACVAATGFTCASGTALYVLWPLGMSWALLPFVLFATRRVVHAPSLRNGVLLTIALALLVLAGHPESVLHVVTVGALYGAFELLCVRRKVARVLLCAMSAGIVTLLVCAIYLLPYLEAAPQSSEYAFRLTWKGVVRSAKTPQVLLSLATDAFPFLHLRKWVQPDIGGTAGESAAAGSIILGLAAYALWRVRSRTTWFFAALSAFVLLADAGWRPIAKFFSVVPLFDITLNERFGFAASCLVAVMAGIAVEEILRRNDRRAAAITLAVIFAFLGAGTCWIAHAFVIEPGPRDWGAHTALAELAGLAAAAIALYAPRWSMQIVLALLLAQRGLTEGEVHHSFPQRAAYPELPIFAPLRNVRDPFRVTGTNWALLPGTNALYGLEDVRGYEAMTFKPYLQTYRIWSTHQPVFFNRTDDLTKPFLSMLNVRFAFDRASSSVPDGWKVVAREHGTVLLENTRVLPRAFVPALVTVGMQSDVALDQMAAVTSFAERAWITADVVPYERINGPGRVTLRGDTIDADMQGDGWIVVSNTAWKGWRAYVDGRRVRTQRANVTVLGVHVPKGRHTVRLVYLPDSFVLGRAVTGATLLIGTMFLFVRRRYDARP